MPHDVVHSPPIVKILLSKRFIGLFWTQFLTSFNDNFYKNAIVALITFGFVASKIDDEMRQNLVILAGASFVLPYFLFSATAGKIADKYDRLLLVRCIKALEILILGCGGVGFLIHNISLMFAMLFLMGVHSTFFSPIKFGILPAYLHKNELVGGNALIETATFIAIILGTIFGTQIILMPHNGNIIASVIMIATAIAGFYTCLKMPRAKNPSPDIVMGANMITHNKEIYSLMGKHPNVLKYILAGSWFWFVAAVIMTLFPLYIKDILFMNQDVYTLMLALFSVGVGIGSVACARVLDGKISARFTPLASVLMGIAILDIGYISVPLVNGTMIGTLTDFLSHPLSWRIMFDFFVISVSGGLYIVPFFALVQDESPKDSKSRMIAGNNIINAAAMVLGAFYMFVTGKMNIAIPDVLLLTGVLCLLGAVIVHIITPDSIFKKQKK